MSAPISTFSFPTTTLYGPGTVEELRHRLPALGIAKPLIVTDPGLLPTPAFSALQKVLGGDFSKWALFSGVHPNPVEQDVIDGAEAYRTHGCDGVIAFGGGSALDVGKAIRLLLKKPQQGLAAFKFEDDWSGLAPCVCVPTTAGTGSEVGRSSVIVLASTGRKTVFFHPALLAKLVILDPELTRGLPPRLTAATGADALTHCIESFTSPAFHPLCDAIALEGVHIIYQSLPRAVRDGNDIEARGRMLVAAAMGAIAFQKDLGAAHSMAHPLSTICGMHHGLANALCLPTVMRFNAARKPGLYRRIGLACGLNMFDARPSSNVAGGNPSLEPVTSPALPDSEADEIVIAALEKWLQEIGIIPGLGRNGVKPEQIEALAAQAIEDGCHATNPVPVTQGDFVELYKRAL